MLKRTWLSTRNKIKGGTMRARLASLLASMLVSGCADVADSMSQMSGIGVVEEERSTFDNANIVRMSPAFLYREGAGIMSGVNTKLGAQWSSKQPDQVAL